MVNFPDLERITVSMMAGAPGDFYHVSPDVTRSRTVRLIGAHHVLDRQHRRRDEACCSAFPESDGIADCFTERFSDDLGGLAEWGQVQLLLRSNRNAVYVIPDVRRVKSDDARCVTIHP